MKSRFDTLAPPILEFELIGADVAVATWDKPETTIVSEGRAGVDAAQPFTVEGRSRAQGFEILVAEQPGGGFLRRHGGSGLAVRCPEGTEITLRSRTTDVALDGVFGKVDVRTSTGDVVVREAVSEVRIVVGSGDVSVARADGECAITSASGDVVVRECGGQLTLQSTSGDIVAGYAAGRITAQSVSGDVRIEAAAGDDTRVQTVSGDVSVGLVRGVEAWVEAHSASGRVDVAIDPIAEPTGAAQPGMIRLRSVSGDIRLTGGAAPSRAFGSAPPTLPA